LANNTFHRYQIQHLERKTLKHKLYKLQDLHVRHIENETGESNFCIVTNATSQGFQTLLRS